MPLQTIIKEGKYQIVLMRMVSKSKGRCDWVCGYVYLDDLDKIPDDEYLANQTYREGKVVGVDTEHPYNWNMSYEEKVEDAVEQVKDVITSYESYLKKHYDKGER